MQTLSNFVRVYYPVVFEYKIDYPLLSTIFKDEISKELTSQTELNSINLSYVQFCKNVKLKLSGRWAIVLKITELIFHIQNNYLMGEMNCRIFGNSLLRITAWLKHKIQYDFTSLSRIQYICIRIWLHTCNLQYNCGSHKLGHCRH